MFQDSMASSIMASTLIMLDLSLLLSAMWTLSSGVVKLSGRLAIKSAPEGHRTEESIVGRRDSKDMVGPFAFR